MSSKMFLPRLEHAVESCDRIIDLSEQARKELINLSNNILYNSIPTSVDFLETEKRIYKLLNNTSIKLKSYVRTIWELYHSHLARLDSKIPIIQEFLGLLVHKIHSPIEDIGSMVENFASYEVHDVVPYCSSKLEILIDGTPSLKTECLQLQDAIINKSDYVVESSIIAQTFVVHRREIIKTFDFLTDNFNKLIELHQNKKKLIRLAKKIENRFETRKEKKTVEIQQNIYLQIYEITNRIINILKKMKNKQKILFELEKDTEAEDLNQTTSLALSKYLDIIHSIEQHFDPKRSAEWIIDPKGSKKWVDWRLRITITEVEDLSQGVVQDLKNIKSVIDNLEQYCLLI